jgi:hypothetical protein
VTYDAVEEARSHYREFAFDSFTIIESAPGKYTFRDARGVEYRRVDFLPGPACETISGFTVDNSGRVHFLRRRGEDAGVAA